MGLTCPYSEDKKKRPWWGRCCSVELAEEEGFEPPDLLQSTVFKTAAIDHSAILPRQKYVTSRLCAECFCLDFYQHAWPPTDRACA